MSLGWRGRGERERERGGEEGGGGRGEEGGGRGKRGRGRGVRGEGGDVIKEGLGRDEAVWVNYSIVHMYFNHIHCITGFTEVVGVSVPDPKPTPAWIAFSIARAFPACYTGSDIRAG